MGYGYLLIGYIFATVFSYNPFGYVFMLIGSILMILGLMTLIRYDRIAYLPPLAGSSLMVVVALYETVFGFSQMFGADPAGFLSKEIQEYIRFGTAFLFHAALIYATFRFCRKLDVKKGVNGAVRNAVVLSVYYILVLISLLDVPFHEDYMKVCSMPMILILFGAYFSVAMMLFTCYKEICPEGDEQMPRKPSRFAFVNKIRAVVDKHNEKSSQAAQDYVRKREEERRAKQEKKK